MPKNRNYARRYASDYHIFRTIFYLGFVRAFLIPFFKLYYDFKVEGRENLPKGKNYIYAGNHVSIFDPPFVSCAVNRPIAYMAKKELFEDGERMQWWVKRLGAFAVDREKPEISTFKTVKDIFTTSWSLGIFPQGGIKESNKLEKIQRGFAVISKHAKADIVPVAIDNFTGYAQKPFEKDKHVTVKIGKPISYKLSAEEIIYQWSQQMSELAGYENCIQKPELEEVK